MTRRAQQPATRRLTWRTEARMLVAPSCAGWQPWHGRLAAAQRLTARAQAEARRCAHG